MRVQMIFATLVCGIALSGCSTPSGPNRYTTELQTLAADCTARGGVLISNGAQSGTPQQDNVCEIRNPSGLSRPAGG